MSYRDKFYKKYVSTHTDELYSERSLEGVRSQFPAWKSYFGRFLPEDKNVKILDLGCGDGGFVCWLRELGYKNAEGIDISEEQIALAKKLSVQNIQQVDLREFLKGKAGVYDLIFARDLLEHFTKEENLEIVELVCKSLGENGVFVAQTVNAGNLFWGRLRHGDFTHELAFTENSIKQLLKVSGFKDMKVFSQGPVIHGLKSLVRHVLWRAIELWPKFRLLVETGSTHGVFTQSLIVVGKK